MKTYIHQGIGFYEVDSELSSNFLIGTTEIDYINNAFILLDDSQLEFKQNNPNASPLEVFRKNIDLQKLKNKKIKEIENYDKSDFVNSFVIDNNIMWLPRDVRTSLKSLIKAYKVQSIDNITLWTDSENPKPITLQTVLLETLLINLEIYAKQCYDVTSQHKNNIQSIDNIQEILDYDYKSGYPEKLNINLNESS